MNNLNTNDLFDTTNAALLAGDFSTAREGLELLSRRPDYVDQFCAPETYTVRYPEMQREPLAGRIREANSAARRNGMR